MAEVCCRTAEGPGMIACKTVCKRNASADFLKLLGDYARMHGGNGLFQHLQSRFQNINLLLASFSYYCRTADINHITVELSINLHMDHIA